jgi:uncharacterized OB-fold protein
MSRTSTTMPAELSTLHPDVWTAPFWEAALEHRLVAQRCTGCGEFRMPPGPFCWNCQTQDAEWIDLPGTGTIYSFSITRQALIPQLADYVPYVVAVVDLDEAPGARLVSTVVDVDPDSVRIGDAVQVHWDDVHERTTVPRFRLREEGERA